MKLNQFLDEASRKCIKCGNADFIYQRRGEDNMAKCSYCGYEAKTTDFLHSRQEALSKFDTADASKPQFPGSVTRG
jgi:predicted nucleic-acid-binding Zn-ribbon protein